MAYKFCIFRYNVETQNFASVRRSPRLVCWCIIRLCGIVWYIIVHLCG